ncbi:hypothetical protein EVAR_94168_1 [Eumeta japonica]|uniref:Uncharacterized protein n=1 Tax=Eumeta variegata TaxID=151549 RepID=A0A4C1UP89_EUMVA|nr:hypothetical protein EVAR_94168_1 [Eumeta japonica]
MCLASLSENPVNSRRYMSKCYMNQGCYKILSNGTQYGLRLHRLQMLLMARLGRGCYLFSRSRDEFVLHKMCALAFKEADYIAENDYKLPDLMMEQS